jgi:pyochelin biosynthesis protein PchC
VTRFDQWFLGERSGQSTGTQLFCLPHSGGGASSYRYWLGLLSGVLDVRAVQFPGRENRRAEPPATDLDALVAELAEAVMARSSGDVILFGHSLGAPIATRLCMALETAGCPVRALFVSGHAGPTMLSGTSRSITAQRFSDMLPEGQNMLTAGDDELLNVAYQLGALPDYVLHNASSRELMIRVLRADLRLIADEFLGNERVSAPITVLAGTDDPLLTGLDFAGWRRVSPGQCPVHRIPGGHFYLANQREWVAEVITRSLARPVV